MKKILISVGTRPNFIKVTQFKKVAKAMGKCDIRIVHTGQHYDRFMSHVFFDQFNLHPDYFLSLEASSPAGQVGEIIMKMSNLIADYTPDILVVPGNVNSTIAAAIAGNKTGTKLAHLESGLRSFDRTMPEEINRIITDELSDLYFVTESSGMENLRSEGLDSGNAFLVGNTMIDTLVAYDEEIDKSSVLDQYGLDPKGYALMTMHRPATVDNSQGLTFLLGLLERVCEQMPLVFPVHPRTTKNIELYGLKDRFNSIENLTVTEPLDYFGFQKLIKHAKIILTDSGGIQEESTFRHVPCLTIRPNTERPVTCEIGTNALVESDIDSIMEKMKTHVEAKGEIPPKWDGRATERVMDVLMEIAD
jgi:UDP-N-acetylglucosamine 2-epimerase (non-hydrolysing)